MLCAQCRRASPLHHTMETMMPECGRASHDAMSAAIGESARRHRPAELLATSMTVRPLISWLDACDEEQSANRRRVGEEASPFLGEQAERGLSLVAVLGDHVLVERPLLLQPVIAFFAR